MTAQRIDAVDGRFTIRIRHDGRADVFGLSGRAYLGKLSESPDDLKTQELIHMARAFLRGLNPKRNH